MINIVGLLGFEHQAVTHLTGTTSMLSDAISLGHWPAFAKLLAVVGAFLAGAAASGFLIQDSTLKLGRRYGAALALESILLSCSVPLLNHQNHWGVCLASAACGLQNAMASTYSGSTVRTTHLSGMFTDLGIFVGHLLRRMPVDWRRLKLCTVIISGFFCGGIGGAAAFRAFGYGALLFPAAFTGAGAVGYSLYRLRMRGVS
jgi:uncharacterized membrane protein YoaK (UPF0700 family)